MHQLRINLAQALPQRCLCQIQLSYQSNAPIKELTWRKHERSGACARYKKKKY